MQRCGALPFAAAPPVSGIVDDQRRDMPIETMLLRPAGRPPGLLAERLVDLLKSERDALTASS